MKKQSSNRTLELPPPLRIDEKGSINVSTMQPLAIPSGTRTIEDALAFIAGHGFRPATFEEAILYSERRDRGSGLRADNPAVLSVIGTRWELPDGAVVFAYFDDNGCMDFSNIDSFLDVEAGVEEVVLVVPLS